MSLSWIDLWALMGSDPLSMAEEFMTDFAYQTGILGSGRPKRYLWTDAFAVCNFLELYRKRGDERYRQLALKTVDQVHLILGRHREDDSRRGWLSGLSDEEGLRHPTIGGLRIGKRLPERRPGEPLDDVLEWERDGQYYHYLTRWMHALNRVGGELGDLRYNLWAIELAKRTHEAFVYRAPYGGRRIYWKMSIDLSRPLITSMGQHDPLDGFVVYNEIQASAPEEEGWPDLTKEIGELEEICGEMDWTTDDPLGIGGLLWNAYLLAKLISSGRIERVDLLLEVLSSSLLGLESYSESGALRLPASRRLAFREMGLTIGLKAAERLQRLASSDPRLSSDEELLSMVKGLTYHTRLSDEIERFWLKHINRENELWREHKEINMVMLATSLAPGSFLGED